MNLRHRFAQPTDFDWYAMFLLAAVAFLMIGAWNHYQPVPLVILAVMTLAAFVGFVTAIVREGHRTRR